MPYGNGVIALHGMQGLLAGYSGCRQQLLGPCLRSSALQYCLQRGCAAAAVCEAAAC